eukprot:3898381-Amphidinium_carterae.1
MPAFIANSFSCRAILNHASLLLGCGDEGYTSLQGDYCAPILSCFCGRIVELSVQKFSSNVVEKVGSEEPGTADLAA